MSHAISGYIGAGRDFASRFRQPPFPGAVRLPYGLALAPVGEPEIDALPPGASIAARIDAMGAGLSATGPVAFVETEYFGGIGGQSTGVWIAGELRFTGFGGLHVRLWWHPKTEVDAPINDALKLAFGLGPEGDEDAFDRLGLGRWRSMETLMKYVDKQEAGR